MRYLKGKDIINQILEQKYNIINIIINQDKLQLYNEKKLVYIIKERKDIYIKWEQKIFKFQ